MSAFVCHAGIYFDFYPLDWLINRDPRKVNGATRAIYLVALLSYFTTSYCQLPSYIAAWSKPEMFRNTSRQDIVGLDGEGGIYVLKNHIKSSTRIELPYLLEYYDKDLILKRSFDLRVTEEEKKTVMEQVLQVKNKLYVFYSVAESSKRLSLYARELAGLTLEPQSEKRKLFEIDVSNKSTIRKKRLAFSFSADSSKIFVLRDVSQIGDSLDHFFFTMLDNDLKILWQKNVPLPYPGGKFRAETIKVSNEGNVYILGTNNSWFDLITIRNQGDSIVRYPIRFKGFYLNSVQIEIQGNNNLFCAGFYSETSTLGVRGIYFLHVDFSTRQVKTRDHEEFDAKFVLQSLNGHDSKWTQERGERGDPAELYRYSLDKLLIGKDGSATLLGEQRYRYSNSQTDYGPRVSPIRQPIRAPANNLSQSNYVTNTSAMAKNYHYVANNILVVKLDPSGQMDWSQKIHKTQDTVDDDGIYSSYLFANIGGKLCFLFNDDPRNLDEDKVQRFKEFNGAKSIVAMVSLDEEGNSVRQWINSPVNADMSLVPKMSKWISESELILFGRKQQYQQLGKLTLK